MAFVTLADALLRGRGGCTREVNLVCAARRPEEPPQNATFLYSLKVRFPRKLMQKYNSLVNTAAYIGSRVAEVMSSLRSGVEI